MRDVDEAPVRLEARSLAAVVVALLGLGFLYFVACFAACWLALVVTR